MLPSKNDWALRVQKDLEILEIDLTEEEIKIKSKDSFKKLIKEKTKQAAFKYLMEKRAPIPSEII